MAPSVGASSIGSPILCTTAIDDGSNHIVQARSWNPGPKHFLISKYALVLLQMQSRSIVVVLVVAAALDDVYIDAAVASAETGSLKK